MSGEGNLICKGCKQRFTMLLILSSYQEDFGSYCPECYPVAARKLEEKGVWFK